MYKKLFIWLFSFCIFANTVITNAAEWYEGGNLYTATLREWRNASQQNKLATCAEIISEVVVDNYFKMPFNATTEDTSQLKEYANQLLLAINMWAGNNENDNTIVNAAALISMLQLGWIDESYLNFISGKKVDFPQPKIQKNIPYTKEAVITENTTPSKSQQKAKTKPKLMSKKAGKEWVKKNVHLRLHFPLEDMKYRLGDYQTTTIGNIERYYFPRINMTFFVIKSSQEFIGFSESKPMNKNRKEN